MSRWTCPHCGGGMPALVPFEGKAVCPWCFEPALTEHDNPEDFLVAIQKHEGATYR